GVAAVLFGATFALLRLLEYTEPQAQAIAASLAGPVILSFPKVAEFLEQQESKKRLAGGIPKPVYDFRGFQIAWPLMVLYGTVMLMSLALVVSSIAGMMVVSVGGSYQGDKAPAATAAESLLNLIITFFGAYLVGRWIGARASRMGVVTM